MGQDYAGDVSSLDGYGNWENNPESNGEQVWVQASSTLVTAQSGEPVYRILQLQDISDRKAAEAQLHHMADHDPLTGLYNRRRLLEELDAEIARSRRYTGQVAVLVLDLDRFKYVNDALGHATGDELITRAADVLRKRVRKGDVIARLGGDEFAVVLSQTDGEAATATAQKLLDGIREEAIAVSTDRTMRVTASVGISLTAGFSILTGPLVRSLGATTDRRVLDPDRRGAPGRRRHRHVPREGERTRPGARPKPR